MVKNIILHAMARLEFTMTVTFEHKPERVTQPCRYSGKSIIGKKKTPENPKALRQKCGVC